LLGDPKATKEPESLQMVSLTVVANAIMNLDAYLMKE
jgi:hypothetical protein